MYISTNEMLECYESEKMNPPFGLLLVDKTLPHLLYIIDYSSHSLGKKSLDTAQHFKCYLRNMIRFIPLFFLKFNNVAFLMELFLEKKRVKFVTC